MPLPPERAREQGPPHCTNHVTHAAELQGHGTQCHESARLRKKAGSSGMAVMLSLTSGWGRTLRKHTARHPRWATMRSTQMPCCFDSVLKQF